MKEVFSYSNLHDKFVVLSHANLFYLRREGSHNNILRCDNPNIAKAWIDGYQQAIDDLPLEAYRIMRGKK